MDEFEVQKLNDDQSKQMATKYVSQDAVIEAVKGRFSMPVDNLIVEVVQKVPAADVVEVVRCGKCRFRGKETHICSVIGMGVASDGFCAWGQRKTDNGT